MRVVNKNFETITEYDLSKGELLKVTTLRENMIPVDNVTKFAPADEDWEQALMYVPYSEPVVSEPTTTQEERITELEETLAMLLSGVTE